MIEGATFFETPETIGFQMDLKPLIQDGIDRINQAVEAYARWLLERAYFAGYEQALEGVWYADAVTPFEPEMFEEFFANLLKEIAS